jgi:prolyl oligopeptidase PreP (S9A serine peptidase family)
MFYSFTSFLSLHTVYRYDVKSAETTFQGPEGRVRSDTVRDAAGFLYEQDGTRVPMFITSKKASRSTEPTRRPLRIRPSTSHHTALLGSQRRLDDGWHYAVPNLREAASTVRSGMRRHARQKQNVSTISARRRNT